MSTYIIRHENIAHDMLVDAQNKESPHATIMASQALEGMEPGQILKLITTSESCFRNIRIFTDTQGHELVKVQKLYEVTTFWIKKANTQPSGSLK